MLIKDILSSGNASSITKLMVLSTAPLITAYIISSFHSWCRLRHFKGPWLAGFSDLWMVRLVLRGKRGPDLTALDNKYGCLARMSSKDLITDDTDILRYISNGKKASYDRSDYYAVGRLEHDFDNIFSTTSVDYHDSLKSKVVAGFSGKDILDIERHFDDQILGLCKLLDQDYLSTDAQTRPMDFSKVAQFFALDVISSITLGYAFGFLAANRDLHDYLGSTVKMIKYLSLAAEVPFLRTILSKNMTIRRVLGQGKLPMTLSAIVQKVIGPRMALPIDQQKPDMVGSFIKHGLDSREIENTIRIAWIAGADSASTTIRATILYICTAPRILSKLRMEIDAAISSGKITRPITTKAEAHILPYLQACIHEGLRIHGHTPALLSKVVPKGGDTIDGRWLPPGTRISMNLHGALRKEAVFGADTDFFRPERWLRSGHPTGTDAEWEEREKKMLRDLYMMFGHGRWSCLGKQMVEIMMNKIFLELLVRYDFTILNPTKPWKCEEYAIYFIEEFWVKVTKRDGLGEESKQADSGLREKMAEKDGGACE